MEIKFIRSFTQHIVEIDGKRMRVNKNGNLVHPRSGRKIKGLEHYKKEDIISRIKDLINKPSETTNEQPKIPENLRIKLMEVLCKHYDLRNSDHITDRALYHAFLDWEKEMTEIILG